MFYIGSQGTTDRAMNVNHSFVEKVMDVFKDKVDKTKQNFLENNEISEVKKKLEKLEIQIEDHFSYLQSEISSLVKQRRSVSINQ